MSSSIENEVLSIPLSFTDSVQFIAGNISNHLETLKPKLTNFVCEELKNIYNEIMKLLNKRVVVETTCCPGQFISNIFARPKRDGAHMLVLNLKNLNKHIAYHHFKMETL